MIKHFPYMAAATSWLAQNGFVRLENFLYISSSFGGMRRTASIHVVAGTSVLAVMVSEDD